MKVCRICEGPLPPRARTLCGDTCRKEERRESVRKAMKKFEDENGQTWHGRYREQRNEAGRERRKRISWKDDPARQAADARRRARKVGATIGEPFTHPQVFERDGWRCGICGEGIDPDLDYPDGRSVSLDHVVPLSRGGAHSLENVQAAHLDCNIEKGDRVPGLARLA